MYVSCGFWVNMMGLLVGLLVAAMVEGFFFAVVCGGEWMWWMWMDVDVDVEVSFCCDFLFSFFVSGGCGMGGGFCGDYW